MFQLWRLGIFPSCRNKFTYFHTLHGNILRNNFSQSNSVFSLLHVNYSQKGVKKVNITFIDRDSDRIKVAAKVGDTLLDVAKDNDIDVEGACGGTLTCSTCHQIFEKVDFDKIPEIATDEELDLLEMAHGLTDTSRLGCQVDVSNEMEGIVLKVPTETFNARKLQ